MNQSIRTCIITRSNEFKENLFRFIHKNESEYIFDENQKLNGRGIYILKDINVFEKFLKKYKLSLQDSEKILNILNKNLKKSKDDILKPILSTLINSDYLIYGIDDNIENIKANKVKLIILPSDINVKLVNKIKKICKIFDVRIIFIKSKNTLKEIFLRDVNIIGIKNKKVVNGIINKTEVEK